MPEHPTWQQVADIAAKVDGAQPGMRGICLRGQPGWGEVFAPLTTVVNTFGGTWFDKDWNAQVDARDSRTPRTSTSTWSARTARPGAAQAGLHRVPERHRAGQGRHVVRRHVGGRIAGGNGLPGRGQDRLRPGAGGQDRRAPAGCTPGPGRSRRPARTRTTPGSSSPGRRARSTRNSSGRSSGWSNVPAGKRDSTYTNPDYLKVARRRSPKPTLDGDPERQPDEPRRAAAPDARHPVRRHPGVHRPRHRRSRRTSARRSPARRAVERARHEPALAEKAGDKYKEVSTCRALDRATLRGRSP